MCSVRCILRYAKKESKRERENARGTGERAIEMLKERSTERWNKMTFFNIYECVESIKHMLMNYEHQCHSSCDFRLAEKINATPESCIKWTEIFAQRVSEAKCSYLLIIVIGNDLLFMILLLNFFLHRSLSCSRCSAMLHHSLHLFSCADLVFVWVFMSVCLSVCLLIHIAHNAHLFELVNR